MLVFSHACSVWFIRQSLDQDRRHRSLFARVVVDVQHARSGSNSPARRRLTSSSARAALPLPFSAHSAVSSGLAGVSCRLSVDIAGFQFLQDGFLRVRDAFPPRQEGFLLRKDVFPPHLHVKTPLLQLPRKLRDLTMRLLEWQSNMGKNRILTSILAGSAELPSGV